jgi:hypothetical protein
LVINVSNLLKFPPGATFSTGCFTFIYKLNKLSLFYSYLVNKSSVLTTATRRHIPEDDILHSQHRGNLKS